MKPEEFKTLFKDLDGDWYDSDYLILYLSFELLVHTVEEEKLFEIIDWSHSEGHQAIEKELKRLYEWWKSYKPKSNTDMDFEENEEVEQANLKILINLRGSLWT